MRADGVEVVEEVEGGARERLVVDWGVVVVVDVLLDVVVDARMFFFLVSIEDELEDDVDDDVRLLEAVSLLRVICGF